MKVSSRYDTPVPPVTYTIELAADEADLLRKLLGNLDGTEFQNALGCDGEVSNRVRRTFFGPLWRTLDMEIGSYPR